MSVCLSIYLHKRNAEVSSLGLLWCLQGTKLDFFFLNAPSFLARSLHSQGFPGGASGKEPLFQCRRDIRILGSIPESGRSPGGGHGNPLQYFCLENPVDRGAEWATVHGSQESDMPKQLTLRYSLHSHGCLLVSK